HRAEYPFEVKRTSASLQREQKGVIERPEWNAETQELMRAFTEMHEARRSGDVELFSKYVAPMFHEAGADSGLFSFHPEGLDKERVRAAFERGLQIRWSVQHPEVYFYGSGNDVAVITCY